MSSYGEPNVQHKGAVQEIIDARQNALKAVSEVRKHRISMPHPNLAPTDELNLPVMGTQAVVDYLLQLRPYRASSRNWQVDFGNITLPKCVSVDGPVRRGWNGETGRRLWLCRQPEIPVRNVSDLISALNMDVHYSSNRRVDRGQSGVSPRGSRTSETQYSIKPEGFPSRVRVDKKTFESVRQGEITAQEAVDSGLTVDESESDETEYVPAKPHVDNNPGDTAGRDGRLETYKVVFGPDRLLKLVELADEVAAEVDMLAEIEPPDIDSDGGDAI